MYSASLFLALALSKKTIFHQSTSTSIDRYYAHHKIPPSPKHPKVIDKQSNRQFKIIKESTGNKMLRKLSSGLRSGVQKFARSASTVISLNRIKKSSFKKSSSLMTSLKKMVTPKSSSTSLSKSKTSSLNQPFDIATAFSGEDKNVTTPEVMNVLTPALTPLQTPAPPIEPPPPGPVPYSPPRDSRKFGFSRMNSMRSIPPPITDGMIRVFDENNKRTSIVSVPPPSSSKRVSFSTTTTTTANSTQMSSNLSRLQTTEQKSQYVEDKDQKSNKDDDDDTKNNTEILVVRTQEKTSSENNFKSKQEEEKVVIPFWAARSSLDETNTNVWFAPVKTTRSEWLLLSLLSGSLTTSSFNDDATLRSVLISVFDGEKWRSCVRLDRE